MLISQIKTEVFMTLRILKDDPLQLQANFISQGTYRSKLRIHSMTSTTEEESRKSTM